MGSKYAARTMIEFAEVAVNFVYLSLTRDGNQVV